ncbi:MAG: efflux RND transporter permease subunit [Spirochaetota bacterium]
MIDRLTDALSRHGRIVLAITAAVMTLAAIGFFRLDVTTEFDVFMPPSSTYLDAMEEMRASFGDGDQLVVLVDVGVDDDALGDLPSIAERLGAIEGVASARLPAPPDVLGLPPAERSAAVEELVHLTGGTLVAEHEGARYTVVRVLLSGDRSPRKVIADVEETFAAASLPIVVSGEPYLQSEVFSYVVRILLTIPALVIVLMLAVFRLRIGSWRATILSLIPAVVGGVLTLGGIAWFRGTISIVSVLVPIFVIVLGSADGLHITSHVMDSLGAGASNRDAVRDTLSAVGGPVIMTTLTTMAGFLSLLMINSGAIRELGVMAAIGVLIAGVATWLIMPTVLLHRKTLPKAPKQRRGLIDRLIPRLRGWPSILLAVGMLAVFIPGALLLRANFSMIDLYKPSSEVRRNIELTAAVLGGSIPLSVVFEAPDRTDPDVANAVLELQDEAEARGIAGTTLSAYTIIRAMWNEASEADADGYPERAVVARTMLTRLRLQNPEIVETFFADDGSARAVFFLSDLDDRTLASFLELAREVGDRHGVELQPVGSAFVIKEMNDQIIGQQAWSLAVALIAVVVLTGLTQRSLSLGLAAAAPIVVTLVTLFGVMGYAGIDLSITTGIMSGLTVGVGIDYAIHYISLLRRERRRGAPDPNGSALGYVGTPVLANALGLAVGFTALVISPLRLHTTLTILIWTTMMASAVLSLTLLPTITGGRRVAARAATVRDASPEDAPAST